MEIISLKENVIAALDFFIKNKPTSINLSQYQLPFVIGSGNAYNTGLILFSQKAAIFADESNFKRLIEAYKPVIQKGLITQAVIISASGGKDSVWEIELAKEYGLKTILLTTKGQSEAAKKADIVYVFKSIAEPYTYNVSTYMGMVLSSTEESPSNIKEFILSLKLPNNFNEYSAYSFVIPDKFQAICPMLDIKKSELFGPHLSLRAFSQGHARHAKFVIRSEKELVISLGEKNLYFGHPDHRFDIPLPDFFNYGGVIALTYYLVGVIQEGKPGYYKDNIEAYTKDYGPKAYGKSEPFELIVPATE